MNNKESYVEAAIFQATDGTKYAINPFATADFQSHYSFVKTENINEESLLCEPGDPLLVVKEEPDQQNIEIHNKKRLLSCTLCNATFRRPDHLKRHIQSIHCNEKYYKCPVCEKDCKRHDTLLKHLKTQHSNYMDSFNCSECPFQCNCLNDLEKHNKTHLLTNRHSCQHCKATFKRRDHMLRHIKTQHLNQFVDCPVCGCGQRYKRRDHVVRHVREKHGLNMLNGELTSDML